MKYQLLSALVFVLIGCGSENSGQSNKLDFQSLDLTGTWLMVTEERRINADTNEYLSSTFVEIKYLFEDTENGVQYDTCWEYGDLIVPYGIKTSDHFYMFPGEPSDTGFTIENKNTFKKVSSFDRDWDPGFRYKSIQTLSKISDQIETDNGTFILNGPVSYQQYSHVCTWTASSNVGNSETLELIVPYDDDDIAFHFTLERGVAVGSYYYSEKAQSKEISLDIISNAKSFQDVVGTNTISGTNVTINIIESNAGKLSGTFDLLGQDNERYSGEFEIIPNR